MSTFEYILAGIAAAIVIWFLVLPAVPPLYARYLAWLRRKASGQ